MKNGSIARLSTEEVFTEMGGVVLPFVIGTSAPYAVKSVTYVI